MAILLVKSADVRSGTGTNTESEDCHCSEDGSATADPDTGCRICLTFFLTMLGHVTWLDTNIYTWRQKQGNPPSGTTWHSNLSAYIYLYIYACICVYVNSSNPCSCIHPMCNAMAYHRHPIMNTGYRRRNHDPAHVK